jgi:hypothetical protein
VGSYCRSDRVRVRNSWLDEMGGQTRKKNLSGLCHFGWKRTLGPKRSAMGRARCTCPYRSGRDGVVCFDGFHSKELHDRLSPKNGQRVTVEYDTLPSIFGGELGYNMHSVGGIILANGTHVLRGDFAGTAGVVASKRGDGTFSARENDCWR